MPGSEKEGKSFPGPFTIKSVGSFEDTDFAQIRQCDQKRPACSRYEKLRIRCDGAGQQRYRFANHDRPTTSSLVFRSAAPIRSPPTKETSRLADAMAARICATAWSGRGATSSTLCPPAWARRRRSTVPFRLFWPTTRTIAGSLARPARVGCRPPTTRPLCCTTRLCRSSVTR